MQVQCMQASTVIVAVSTCEGFIEIYFYQLAWTKREDRPAKLPCIAKMTSLGSAVWDFYMSWLGLREFPILFVILLLRIHTNP